MSSITIIHAHGGNYPLTPPPPGQASFSPRTPNWGLTHTHTHRQLPSYSVTKLRFASPPSFDGLVSYSSRQLPSHPLAELRSYPHPLANYHLTSPLAKLIFYPLPPHQPTLCIYNNHVSSKLGKMEKACVLTTLFFQVVWVNLCLIKPIDDDATELSVVATEIQLQFKEKQPENSEMWSKSD